MMEGAEARGIAEQSGAELGRDSRFVALIVLKLAVCVCALLHIVKCVREVCQSSPRYHGTPDERRRGGGKLQRCFFSDAATC
jgi:hypothetical protein